MEVSTRPPVKPTFANAIFIKSGVAALDQALLSTLSLVFSVVLIKTAPAEEFGYYSVAFSVSLFLVSVQNAIVNTPLVVLLPAKRGEEKRRYVGSLCYGQFMALAPGVCFTLVLLGLFRLWGLDDAKANVASAVSVASLGIMFREFLRAHSFAEEAPRRVLGIDLLYSLLVASLLGVTYLSSQITAPLVFLMMGASSFLVALGFSRRQGWRYEKDVVQASFQENWTFGRWALFGVLVTHLQNYSYLYLLGTLRGSAAVAQVAASRVVLTPLLLAQAGWANIAVPHGSRLREKNLLSRFVREQVLANLGFAGAAVAYLLVMRAASGFLQAAVLTEDYTQFTDYLGLWGAIFVANFFSVNASCGLQVLKEFRKISQLNFLTMIVTVGSAYLLIRMYAIKGSLAAVLIGEILLASGLWFRYARSLSATLRPN